MKTTITTLAFHGTTDYATNFKYIDTTKQGAYFCDNLNLAKHFALKEDEGGLFEGEIATVIRVKLSFNNPKTIHENDWETLCDICNFDKAFFEKQGYDGVICKNSSNCTYYVVFNVAQIEIKSKEILKHGTLKP